jgi:NAD-dependent SIR2 family protein deacetylase
VDVMIVNNREVIKCVHCSGTGTCQKPGYLAVNREIEGKQIPGAVLTCPKCGSGVWRPAIVGFFTIKLPDPSVMSWPVCGVCGGKGYVIVN